jgi:signal transduction histidine kinase
MKDWFRGPRGGLLAFVLITGLVGGALGWATAAALRVEREQLAERAEAEHAARVGLALWRLDSRVAPLLARELNRPFDHYSSLYAPPLVFNNRGVCATPGMVLETSPLLSAELQRWMLLHFRVDRDGWGSPQAPSPSLLSRLADPRLLEGQPNVTPERKTLLMGLSKSLPPVRLLAIARDRTEPATLHDTTLVPPAETELTQNRQNPNPPMQQGNDLYTQKFQNPQSNYAQPNQSPGQPAQGNNEYNKRYANTTKMQEELQQQTQRVSQNQALNNFMDNGENWMRPPPKPTLPPPAGPASKPGKNLPKVVASSETTVHLSPMVPLWVATDHGEEHLLLLRMVQIDDKETCQGIVLDWQGLQAILTEAVTDLFPDARLAPAREAAPPQPERTMTALPFELDPGPVPAPADPGWTTLRVWLSLAWSAAGIALLGVALGGWSLIDLSERRIRFVSAVTHELRSPLTTLRLYIDMLLGGLVRDEKQREEYLQTLNAEADRLNRLVSNVLDFSRLEKQNPHMTRAQLPVSELLAQVQATWQGRCHDAGKELVVESSIDLATPICTDPALLQQILGNLLDNACKYSRGADDARVWLSVRPEKGGVVFEVEDRGPGVPAAERRSIFRAFRRGRQADVTGGVGLGLALAQRWTRLLGGRIDLRPPGTETGACFQVWLPM